MSTAARLCVRCERPLGEGLFCQYDGTFVLDREGTVVCLSNFVEAVIDVPFESTSVNTNLVYEANPDTVPPVGTRVRHAKFGEGRVLEVEGEGVRAVVTVQFAVGVKRLALGYAPLETVSAD